MPAINYNLLIVIHNTGLSLFTYILLKQHYRDTKGTFTTLLQFPGKNLIVALRFTNDIGKEGRALLISQI